MGRFHDAEVPHALASEARAPDATLRALRVMLLEAILFQPEAAGRYDL